MSSNYPISRTDQRHGRGGSRTVATSKMDHFVIMVNGWKRLDVAAVPAPLVTRGNVNSLQRVKF